MKKQAKEIIVTLLKEENRNMYVSEPFFKFKLKEKVVSTGDIITIENNTIDEEKWDESIREKKDMDITSYNSFKIKILETIPDGKVKIVEKTKIKSKNMMSKEEAKAVVESISFESMKKEFIDGTRDDELIKNIKKI